jgi:putative transposase
VIGDDPLEIGAYKPLRTKHFHGVSSGNQHPHLLKSRYGKVRFLGITSSPAFVREPEGNGCAERFIRTLKENLLWLKTFDTVEELRLALHEFQRQYNETWLIGRHGYKAPAQVRHERRCALADAA